MTEPVKAVNHKLGPDSVSSVFANWLAFSIDGVVAAHVNHVRTARAARLDVLQRSAYLNFKSNTHGLVNRRSRKT